MGVIPFRSNSTWLDDVDLILLDALFDHRASFRLLRRVVFRSQWNLGYSHDLTDEQLRIRIQNLVDREVLLAEHRPQGSVLAMTPQGGGLWSDERCPDWKRFCSERYTETSCGRELMSVVAVSSEIRDEFLRLWTECPHRHSVRRRATSIRNVRNFDLVPWNSFDCYHVGLATYQVQKASSVDEYRSHRVLQQRHIHRLEQERSWWRTVAELQRFVGDDR